MECLNRWRSSPWHRRTQSRFAASPFLLSWINADSKKAQALRVGTPSPDAASLEELANSISQFAWIADASGSIYWYNQRWYDYTGTTLQQMRGWGWRMCHHPEHVDRVVEHISRSFQTGEPWEDTFPLRSKDGTYRWFLSRAMPVRNRAGAVTHWFGTNTDVSEQRAAQEELRTSSLLLEKILESSTDCIKILDLDGALRLMNAGGRVLMEIDDFLAFE
jgi:PAS domain S-box-containing protein